MPLEVRVAMVRFQELLETLRTTQVAVAAVAETPLEVLAEELLVA